MLFAGAWSDKHDIRKPFLVFPFIGEVVTMISELQGNKPIFSNILSPLFVCLSDDLEGGAKRKFSNDRKFLKFWMKNS